MSPAIPDIFEIPELTPFLLRLQESDAAVRRIAVLDLADLEDEAALPFLIDSLLRDPDASVRLEAARVLAAWETPEVVTALLDGLTDAATQVAEAAAQSLSELKDVSLAPLLVERAPHPSAFVRAAVLRGLRELRYPQAYATAVKALDDADAHVRREAVTVIGWLKQSDALTDLARLATGDPVVEVRRAATGALGLAADAKVLPSLYAALNDQEWQVREEAAITLGKLKLPEAEAALTQSLGDEYWQVKLQSVRALGRLRARKVLAELSGLFHHPISNLRKEVALALGEIGDTAALPLLEGAIDDADPDVRKSVRIALAQIGRQ
ncbi:MAG: HEAT repeat domain-containing protein [Rhodocyclaceae bacterium]|nr:HEAT repeat domain-containing protein [Rhodocyclaceae bacterium]